MNSICITKEHCGIVASRHLISRSNVEWPSKWNGMSWIPGPQGLNKNSRVEECWVRSAERNLDWNGIPEWICTNICIFHWAHQKHFPCGLGGAGKFRIFGGRMGGRMLWWTMAADKLLHMLTKLGSYCYWPIDTKELKLVQTKLKPMQTKRKLANGHFCYRSRHFQWVSLCVCMCVCRIFVIYLERNKEKELNNKKSGWYLVWLECEVLLAGLGGGGGWLVDSGNGNKPTTHTGITHTHTHYYTYHATQKQQQQINSTREN